VSQTGDFNSLKQVDPGKETFMETLRGKHFIPNTLQMKMVLLVTGLLLLVILLTGIIFSNFLGSVIEEEIGQKALMVSESVASIPQVQAALLHGDPNNDIQRLAEDIRARIGAEFIVVGDRQGRRYSHPDPEKLGKHMVGGDNNWSALMLGKAYISKAVGTLGPSIRGKAPIIARSGEVIGVVSVGYLLEDVNSFIRQAQAKVAPYLPIVLLFGIGGAIWIAGTFKKAIFGLEPQEIAGILQERTAILESIRSGIVATNDRLDITLVNHAALKSLDRLLANRSPEFSRRFRSPRY
jgi:two-component system, CitB family, sensor kinase